jgi:hypothetical protein
MAIKTTHASSIFLPRSAYDVFLFAQVGESGNNMPFTVLSALARRDVDPWEEAAELARMPEKLATDRLASLIGAPPSGLAAHLDPVQVAASLVALLPNRGGISGPLADAVRNAPLRSRSRTAMAVIVSIFLFGAIWVFQNSPAKTRVDTLLQPSSAQTAPSTTVR